MIVLKPINKKIKKQNNLNVIKKENEKNKLLKHNIYLMDIIVKNDYYVTNTNLINIDFQKFHIFNGKLQPIKDKENYKNTNNNLKSKNQQYFNIYFFNDLVCIDKIYKNLKNLLKFKDPLFLFNAINLIDFVFLENQTLIQFINVNDFDVYKITQLSKTQEIETMKMLNRLFHNFMDKNKMILTILMDFSQFLYEKRAINLKNTMTDLQNLVLENIEILNTMFLNILEVKRLLNYYNHLNKS